MPQDGGRAKRITYVGTEKFLCISSEGEKMSEVSIWATGITNEVLGETRL